MSRATQDNILYAKVRALEDAADLPGVRPLRIEPIGIPLYAVELSATVEEREAFDLLDRYIGLAIAEVGFTRVQDIAEFLGISEAMVDRVLRFLGGIGHLEGTADALVLSDRGLRAVRDGHRYTEKRERLRLYFDAVRCGPLRTSHYTAAVRILDKDAAYAQNYFRLIPRDCDFRLDAVDRLVQRPDRGEYDLPDELRNPSVEAVGEAYLPCYAIRALIGERLTTLVYSGVADLRDHHLEEIVNGWPRVAGVLEVGDCEPSRERFEDWMLDQDISPSERTVTWIDHRGFRLNLKKSRFSDHEDRARAKGIFQLSMLGSYVAPKNHVLQLWCEDAPTRTKAVMSRAISYMTLGRRSQPDAAAFLEQICRQLEPDREVTLDDVQKRAKEVGYAPLEFTD